MVKERERKRETERLDRNQEKKREEIGMRERVKEYASVFDETWPCSFASLFANTHSFGCITKMAQERSSQIVTDGAVSAICELQKPTSKSQPWCKNNQVLKRRSGSQNATTILVYVCVCLSVCVYAVCIYECVCSMWECIVCNQHFSGSTHETQECVFPVFSHCLCYSPERRLSLQAMIVSDILTGVSWEVTAHIFHSDCHAHEYTQECCVV